MEILVNYPENSSWLELSRSAFENNIRVYRNLMDAHESLGTVLKGNAYGHGFEECLEITHAHIDIIFVINPIDAFKIRNYEKLRDLPRKRIIVLGPVSPTEIVQCARRIIEVCICDNHWNEAIRELKASEQQYGNAYRPLITHIHVDTGLGREGFLPEHIDQDIAFLKEVHNLIHVKGVMSHFANVEDVTDQNYAQDQLKKLDEAYRTISKIFAAKHKLEKHIGQSASSFILAQSRYDIMRVGIALYGLWPSKETRLSAKVVFNEVPKLQAVLSWKCKSQSVKNIKSGSYIGYGCSFKAGRDLRIALLPVGYYDGYPRLLSNKAHVLIHGKRCKVLGRVMMNHIIVDITEATENDDPVVATLLGIDKQETVSAEQIAEWSETINYEAVARIGSHLKRVVVD